MVDIIWYQCSLQVLEVRAQEWCFLTRKRIPRPRGDTLPERNPITVVYHVCLKGNS